MFAGTVAGCGGTGTTDTTSCSNASTGAEAKFVTNALTVPQQRADYAMDINGDGKPDNQLGNIIGALAAQGLNTQDGVTQAVTSGGVAVLIDETGADLTNNDCAQALISAAKMPAAPPKYDGSDSFTIDTSLGGGTFKGKITSGTFNSNSPITATVPTELTVLLPLVAGSDPVKLAVTGAHVTFTKSGDGIMKGQLNGAIKSTSVQTDVIPSVAKLLSDKVAADPTTSTNMQILSIFDTGGEADTTGKCSGVCLNSDGTCAVAGDKKISNCEVSTNSIIKNVLAPDVQMFAADGSYKPNKDNTMKDSLSLGLAFTAVKASF
jgi:hypothetical protein